MLCGNYKKAINRIKSCVDKLIDCIYENSQRRMADKSFANAEVARSEEGRTKLDRTKLGRRATISRLQGVQLNQSLAIAKSGISYDEN